VLRRAVRGLISVPKGVAGAAVMASVTVPSSVFTGG
jgi:hypothetical protein